MSIERQTALLLGHAPIAIKDGEITPMSYCKNFFLYFNPKAKNALIRSVHSLAEKWIKTLSSADPIEKKTAIFHLARAVVQRYKNHRDPLGLTARLDQYIVKKRMELWPYRFFGAQEYQIDSNRKDFKRWLSYDFAPDIFIEHTPFATFLLKTHIASAMAMWGDEIQCINNQPHILCEGRLVDWEKVKDFIYIAYHPDSHSYRLYDKRTGEAMEYLGAKQGLIHCDRYTQSFPVLTQIDSDEVQHVQSLGRLYLRPGEISSRKPEQSRDHILQVVSNQVSNEDSAFAKIFKNLQHPFLRLITPDGKVKAIGFVKYNHNHNLLSQGKGDISSPDFIDQQGNMTQYITHIPITKEEAQRIEMLSLQMRQEDLVFNSRAQNCVSFIKYILRDLNLVYFSEGILLFSILRDLFFGCKERSFSVFSINHSEKNQSRLTSLVYKILHCVIHCFFKPLLLLLGETPFYKLGERADKIQSFNRLIRWIKEPIFISLPCEIMAWQMGCASTEKVKKNKRIRISSKSPENTSRLSIQGTPGFGTVGEVYKSSSAKSKPAWFFHFLQVVNKIHQMFFTKRYVDTLPPEIICHNEESGVSLDMPLKTDLRVINHSEQSYLWKMELLKSARQSLEVSFNFAGGKTFDKFLALVNKKLSAISFFKVHLLLSDDLLSKDQIKMLEELKKKFGNRFNYLVTDRLFLFKEGIKCEENHAKMMVVDGQYFVVGGSGIDEKMSREASLEKRYHALSLLDNTFRDSDIIGYGNLAETIRGQFYNLYQLWARKMDHLLEKGEGFNFPLLPNLGRCSLFHHDEGLIKQASTRFVVSGPEHHKKNPIIQAYKKYIDQSQNDIQIANLYFNPDSTLQEAFKRAKNRKVKIVGHFNGIGRGISLFHYNYILANRSNYALVDEAFEYRVPDQLYHKKVATFDRDVAIIGSFNLGQKSTQCDHESVLIIEDKNAVSALKEAFIEDERRSTHFRFPTEISSHIHIFSKAYAYLLGPLLA